LQTNATNASTLSWRYVSHFHSSANEQYCTSGDLGSLIRRTQRNNAIVHEEKIWNVFLQITLALDHCHWPADRRKPGSRVGTVADGNTHTQVLHRDLKPENVFLSGEFIKLGDFGLSKDMAGSAFTSTYVGVSKAFMSNS
jgi:NIMA (never in mitosis gene a)-related kinase